MMVLFLLRRRPIPPSACAKSGRAAPEAPVADGPERQWRSRLCRLAAKAPTDAILAQRSAGEWASQRPGQGPEHALHQHDGATRMGAARKRERSAHDALGLRERQWQGQPVADAGEMLVVAAAHLPAPRGRGRDRHPHGPRRRGLSGRRLGRARQARDRARPPEDATAAGGPAHACAVLVVDTRQSQAPPRQWLLWQAALYLACLPACKANRNSPLRNAKT